MRVLVIGSKGQLGKCLHKISTDFPRIDFEFTHRQQLNICDRQHIDRYFSEKSFDFCVNCSAFTAVDLAEKTPEKAFSINAEALGYLAKICDHHNTKLIHISTDYVFDGSKNTPYYVSDTPNPINIYGESKLEGEKQIIANTSKHYTIRTSWLYSEFEGNFYSTIKKKLQTTSEDLFVVDDQIGKPTNAYDLANAILSIVQNEKTPHGLHHFSGDRIMSWYDFALSIADEIHSKTKIHPVSSTHYPTVAKRPKYSVLKNTL